MSSMDSPSEPPNAGSIVRTLAVVLGNNCPPYENDLHPFAKEPLLTKYSIVTILPGLRA